MPINISQKAANEHLFTINSPQAQFDKLIENWIVTNRKKDTQIQPSDLDQIFNQEAGVIHADLCA